MGELFVGIELGTRQWVAVMVVIGLVMGLCVWVLVGGR